LPHPGGKGVKVDIYSLNSGATYVVKKQFSDYYGNAFEAGEKLTYLEKHFLPYHGGHTIVFKERNLYLQEEATRTS